MKHQNNTSRLAKFAKLAGLTAGILASIGTMSADAFTNGGFEDGTFGGWTAGGGRWSSGGLAVLTSANYSSGGARYDMSYNASAVVGPGTDIHTGGLLNTVYSGNYSARINNDSPGYGVSLIKQTVTNYTDASIFFAWAAVLEDSHGANDSDNFRIMLTNDTDSTIMYDVTYSSFDAPSGLFNTFGAWNWTNWQIAQFDVSADMGDTFTLTLLAADCAQGAHAGYVYLDGFGAQLPPPADGSAVPEPSTYGLMGAAALLGAVVYRRRSAKKQAA